MNVIATLLILTGWLLTTARFARRSALHGVSRTVGASLITAGMMAVI